jgi:uncharacterized protein with gpF-like domain
LQRQADIDDIEQEEDAGTFRAFHPCQAFRSAVADPRVKYSVWRFIIVDDKRLCAKCLRYDGDVYELEDPDDLYGMFPYGEWVDEDMFAPNVHPNCRCVIVKEEDVWKEEQQNE